MQRALDVLGPLDTIEAHTGSDLICAPQVTSDISFDSLSIAKAGEEDEEPKLPGHPEDPEEMLVMSTLKPFGTFTGFVNPVLELDGYALRYYDLVVCANTVLLDDRVHNPFRYVIVPMASSSGTVLSAVIAIGASKLAHREPRYHHRALLHRQRVLVNLRESLAHADTASMSYLEALASAIMLCWYDVSHMMLSF